MYAIILAGGKGIRLHPLTLSKPKPMVEVNGKPILEYQIEHYRAHGVTNIIVASGYKSEIIKEYIQDGASWGVKVEHLDLGEEPDTSFRVKNALSLIPSDETDVFISAGDKITDLNLSEMLEVHRTEHRLITLNVSKVQFPHGVIFADAENKVRSFEEKPEFLINNFFLVIDRSIEPQILDEGNFFECGLRGFHTNMHIYYDPTVHDFHISTPEDLMEAERQLQMLTNF